MMDTIIFEGFSYSRNLNRKGDHFKRKSQKRNIIHTIILHRVIWEKTNGPIPDGKIIKHIDGDPCNLSLDNLMCVWKGRAPRRSHRKQKKPEPCKVKSCYIEIGFDNDPVPRPHKKRNYPPIRRSPISR